MRRVIGIGETILDILFKNNQPTAAVPGGSVFNGLVSLGRAGANVLFISEVGSDKVGRIILDFMKENGISTDSVMVYSERKSPVSLAFLNEKNDAEYFMTMTSRLGREMMQSILSIKTILTFAWTSKCPRLPARTLSS